MTGSLTSKFNDKSVLKKKLNQSKSFAKFWNTSEIKPCTFEAFTQNAKKKLWNSSPQSNFFQFYAESTLEAPFWQRSYFSSRLNFRKENSTFKQSFLIISLEKDDLFSYCCLFILSNTALCAQNNIFIMSEMMLNVWDDSEKL